MKLNEYGIFEYAKNGHSLGALPGSGVYFTPHFTFRGL